MSYSEQERHLLRTKELSQSADRKLFTENERWQIEHSRPGSKDKSNRKNARNNEDDGMNESQREGGPLGSPGPVRGNN